jgi:hypothetical protein
MLRLLRETHRFGRGIIAALALLAIAPALAQDRKPNIVFILADNLG